MFEADTALVQFAAVARGNAVHHARGVESANYLARPFLSFQEPAQQDGKNLMRINEAAVFCNIADTVGVTVCSETGMAIVLYHSFLKQSHVRLDRLRINAWEKRIQLLTNSYVPDASLFEDIGQNAAAGAVHGIDHKSKIRFSDETEISEAADCANVGLLQINFFDWSGAAIRHSSGAKFVFNHFHDRGRGRAAELRFKLHSIPVPRVVAGSDDYTSGCTRSLDRQRDCRSGAVITGELYRIPAPNKTPGTYPGTTLSAERVSEPNINPWAGTLVLKTYGAISPAT